MESKSFDATPSEIRNIVDAIFHPDFDSAGWVWMQADNIGRAYIEQLFPHSLIVWRMHDSLSRFPDWKAQWIDLPKTVSATETKLPQRLVKLCPVDEMSPPQLAFLLVMGRQHVRGGAIHVRQQKTGTELAIPVHVDLQAVLDATSSEHLTFLTTAFGKPFTAPGFTNWFRDMCNEAGLSKGTSAHGLRKAACRRLAEAGCSANEIAAISGHVSLREVERYTKAADQARMARAAIKRLARDTS